MFSLSVPVKGMERLVLEVGGTSGKYGSKFASSATERTSGGQRPVFEPPLSKRQSKKQRNSRGVEGLHEVPCGMRPAEHFATFAVEGTVAHLICRVYAMMTDTDIVDDEHCLVFCEVVQAFVHASYWDRAKSLFRPGDESPPYLTFFGSQAFGYTVTKLD